MKIKRPSGPGDLMRSIPGKAPIEQTEDCNLTSRESMSLIFTNDIALATYVWTEFQMFTVDIFKSLASQVQTCHGHNEDV